MRNFVYFAGVACVCVAVTGAQTPTRKEPAVYVSAQRGQRIVTSPPGVRYGMRRPRELTLAPPGAAELAKMAGSGPRQAVGIHRELPENALSNGGWEAAPNGSALWRMAIRSPGSDGLRLEFRNFSVGEGKVWLYDGRQVEGPYTGQGIFDNGHFWSATVDSETVTLEYEPADGASITGDPPFEIVTLAHQARNTARRASLLAVQNPDPAASCHLDPNCYPGWQPAMSMVGKLSFEDEGLSYVCSGSMIATRDNSFKPYLLTAGHCINNEEAARSLQVYWTYQTAACGAAAPDQAASAKSSPGGHLLASGTIEQGDYSLVLLKDVPSGVTFSGWDAGDPEISTPLVGIHHPKGSWKRISFGARTPDSDAVVEGDLAPAGYYLQVLWDKGRVEPGSSGSPLYSSPGVVVGTLTYAPASPSLTACDITPFYSGYGRFSNTYTHIKSYVENLPSAYVTPSKTDLKFALVNGAGGAAQTLALSTDSTGDIAYRLRADEPFIVVNAPSGSLTAGKPAQAAIAIDPSKLSRPGVYTGTVTVLSGAADPKYINVTATVKVDQSNVVASVTPNPVRQSGGQWNFTVKLAETAGAPTRVTAMRVNGVDYSGSISAFFGADRIEANGAISAPLHAVNQPVGEQYLEFEGVDEAGGQQWYRVVTVSFR
jgi:hypothetical protein